VLTIANFNIHAGIDGWGRPFDYLSAITSLGTDVIALEEAWTSEDDAGDGQAEQAARALGYQVVTEVLGEGRRVRPQPGAGDSWLARPLFSERTKPLYMDGLKQTSAQVRALPRWQEADRGVWGIALLVHPDLPIEAVRVLPMSALRADRVRRAALVVDLTVEGRPISVVGTHMSHLHYGSHRNWSQLRMHLRDEARPDAVLAGDMNTWGPLLHMFMPGWSRAVVGPTWPAWRPHSQIDHILVRGGLRVASGEVLADAGSDHRPVLATVALD